MVGRTLREKKKTKRKQRRKDERERGRQEERRTIHLQSKSCIQILALPLTTYDTETKCFSYCSKPYDSPLGERRRW